MGKENTKQDSQRKETRVKEEQLTSEDINIVVKDQYHGRGEFAQEPSLEIGFALVFRGKVGLTTLEVFSSFHLKSQLANQARFSYLLINLPIWMFSQELISRDSLMSLLSMQKNVMFSSHHMSECLISGSTKLSLMPEGHPFVFYAGNCTPVFLTII